MIQKTIDASNNIVLPSLINNLTLQLSLVDLNTTSILWAKVYKKSDFPALTFTTDYFIVYSTDHDNNNGGIHCGTLNDIERLSDFEYVGLILDGDQCETPFLSYNPNDANGRFVRMYYHTDSTDPTNGGIQRTKLRTTTGGDLVTSTWVQETDPQGSEVNDQHLGYFKYWSNGEKYIGLSYKRGIDEATGYIGQWQYYYAPLNNDLAWERGGSFDHVSFVDNDRLILPTYGHFFKTNNQWWWLGFQRPNPNTSGNGATILCKATKEFEIRDVIAVLNDDAGTGTFRLPEILQVDNILYIYFSVYGEGISVAKFNINQL